MDDYTLQQELEALAGNAFSSDLDKDHTAEPMKDTITRWQKLFKLSSDEAIDRIQSHRNNLTRTKITNDHWAMLRAEKETDGYDREAYEYELDLQRKKAALPEISPSTENSTVTYLVELAGPLSDPGMVRSSAGMKDTPSVVSGKSVEDDRPVWLCVIDGAAKDALLRWAADEGRGFEPNILVDPRSLR